jgi:hypothetical protein
VKRSRFIFAAFVFIAAGSGARAEDETRFDPPNKIYATGATPSDPAVLSRAPKFEKYSGFLPTGIDLSARMPEPGDQGAMPSCTSWAVGYAARSYYTNYFENRSLKDPRNIPSPAYIYTIARGNDASGSCPKGSSAINNVEVLKAGALSLGDFPYDADAACHSSVTDAQKSRATDFRVDGLTRLEPTNIEDLRGKLAEGNPIVISFRVSRPFENFRGRGTYADRQRSDVDTEWDGWHMMTLIGYDDARQAFRLINSWGKGWGDRGYAWLSYDLFKTHVREAYMLNVKAPPAPEPAPPPVPPFELASPIDFDVSRYSCAHLTLRTEGRAHIVDGFVEQQTDLDDLKRRAGLGEAIVIGDVKLAPWPQCEVLLTLAKALSDRPNLPGIDIGRKAEFVAGDILPITVKSPPNLSYIYVSYIQADGTVVHLAQPAGPVPATTLPDQSLVFGDGKDGRQTFRISAPFGQELIVAIAARSPLFETPLPSRQSDREYLSALRRALIYKSDPKLPDRELGAAMVTIETKKGRP